VITTIVPVHKNEKKTGAAKSKNKRHVLHNQPHLRGVKMVTGKWENKMLMKVRAFTIKKKGKEDG